jgi:3-deoxy-D-manno-octulosonic acid (KDO) 8-phosphate synthase
VVLPVVLFPVTFSVNQLTQCHMALHGSSLGQWQVVVELGRSPLDLSVAGIRRTPKM